MILIHGKMGTNEIVSCCVVGSRQQDSLLCLFSLVLKENPSVAMHYAPSNHCQEFCRQWSSTPHLSIQIFQDVCVTYFPFIIFVCSYLLASGHGQTWCHLTLFIEAMQQHGCDIGTENTKLSGPGIPLLRTSKSSHFLLVYQHFCMTSMASHKFECSYCIHLQHNSRLMSITDRTEMWPLTQRSGSSLPSGLSVGDCGTYSAYQVCIFLAQGSQFLLRSVKGVQGLHQKNNLLPWNINKRKTTFTGILSLYNTARGFI